MIKFFKKFKLFDNKVGDEGEKNKSNPPSFHFGEASKWWLLLAGVVAFFVVLAILAVACIFFQVSYKNVFYPGTRLGSVALAGMTREQALDFVEPITDKIEKDGMKVIYQGDGGLNLDFTGAVSAEANPDLARNILTFDNYKTVNDIFAAGHGNNFWQNIKDQWLILIQNRKFQTSYLLDEALLRQMLADNFSDREIKVDNAKPTITWQGNNYTVAVSEEKSGKTFDYDKAIREIKLNLDQLKNNPVTLEGKVAEPEITKAEIEGLLPKIDYVLASSLPKFAYNSSTWSMDKKKLSAMLEFRKAGSEIVLGLNHDLFMAWFNAVIAPKTDVEPKNALIEMKDGQLQKISANSDGLKADAEKAYKDANASLLSLEWPVQITVNKVEPEVAVGDINDLGIKEIIGKGESNFAGSPANRRHNIANGASKVHGVLIKPGEEFSLINTLGDVDGSTGYLQELVIKGNKTMPEYGGGLCQIGTTVFRAAMGSGLPITERRNHSYNVTYYLENGLPGVDATIYIPHPDVRFINDTGNYILIQAKITGDKLTFEFWGTKDGRKAERTKPKVWDWVSPPPTKTIETTDLAPGKKKCTESAHKGVKASFDYFITYADGTEKKQNFYSVYKPWQAVCLVGVEKLSSTTAPVIGTSDNPASSTTSTN
ncbi:MAG: VanW family protein [Desulfobacula sp.]|jgi:vancomycin resistance protein YoaR